MMTTDKPNKLTLHSQPITYICNLFYIICMSIRILILWILFLDDTLHLPITISCCFCPLLLGSFHRPSHHHQIKWRPREVYAKFTCDTEWGAIVSEFSLTFSSTQPTSMDSPIVPTGAHKGVWEAHDLGIWKRYDHFNCG